MESSARKRPWAQDSSGVRVFRDFVGGIGTTRVYGGAHLYRVPFDDMRSIKGVGGKTFLDFCTIGAD